MVEDERAAVLPREAGRLETSIAWIEPALRERTTNAGSPAIFGGSWTISGASGPLAAPDDRLECAPAGRRDESCDRDGPQPVDEAVEEEQEEEQVGGHEEAGHRDADVRDGVLLDPRQQVNENVNVPTSIASRTCRILSRYQRRM